MLEMVCIQCNFYILAILTQPKGEAWLGRPRKKQLFQTTMVRAKIYLHKVFQKSANLPKKDQNVTKLTN